MAQAKKGKWLELGFDSPDALWLAYCIRRSSDVPPHDNHRGRLIHNRCWIEGARCSVRRTKKMHVPEAFRLRTTD